MNIIYNLSVKGFRRCLTIQNISLSSNTRRRERFYSVRVPGTVNAVVDKGQLQIEHPSWTKPLVFHPVWLRDHCRCPSCYNSETKKKLVDTVGISENLVPRTVRADKEQLFISWSDQHSSTYNYSWLEENIYEGREGLRQQIHTEWGGQKSEHTEVACVQYSDLASNVTPTTTRVLDSFIKYGYAVITGAPNTADALRTISKETGLLRPTYRGDVQTLLTSPGYQVPHTLQSFFTEPAGAVLLQWRGIRSHDLTLFDGFNVAEKFGKQHPEEYQTLSQLPVCFRFQDEEEKKEYVTMATVLRHSVVAKELAQVRFHVGERGPISGLNPGQLTALYGALEKWTELLGDSQFGHCLELKTGTVVLVDNWRVLVKHDQELGENMNVGYIGHSDIYGKARNLGIISTLNI